MVTSREPDPVSPAIRASLAARLGVAALGVVVVAGLLAIGLA